MIARDDRLRVRPDGLRRGGARDRRACHRSAPREVRLALLDERGDALRAVLADEAAAERVGLAPEPLLEREVARRARELPQHRDGVG